MLNEPKEIFLQVGSQTPTEADYADLKGVTFHTSKIMSNDIEYINALDFLKYINSTDLFEREKDLIKDVFEDYNLNKKSCK